MLQLTTIQMLARRAAAKSFLRKDPSLTLDIPLSDKSLLTGYAEPNVKEQAGKLFFSGVEDKLRLSAEYFYLILIKKQPTTKWFVCIQKIWRKEISANSKVSGKVLALLSLEYDILALAKNAIEMDNFSVFDAEWLIRAGLEERLSIKADSLIEFCEMSYSKTKGDLAAGVFFDKLKNTMDLDCELCRDVIVKLKDNLREHLIPLYNVAMFSWFGQNQQLAITHLIYEISSDLSWIAKNAIWALAKLGSSANCAEKNKEQILGLLFSIADSDSHNSSDAKNYLTNFIGSDVKLNNKLIEIAETADEAYLRSFEYQIFVSIKNISPNIDIERFFRLISCLEIQDHGVFDYILDNMLKDKQITRHFLLEIFERLILNPKNSSRIEQFTSLLQSSFCTISNEINLRNYLFTYLITHEGQTLALLGAEYSNYLHLHKVENLETSSEYFNSVDGYSVELICSRILGYLIHEKQIISFLFSIFKFLENKNEKEVVLQYIEDLFVLDYPGVFEEETKKFLYQTDKKSYESVRLREILKNLAHYSTLLESLPHLSEFNPRTSDVKLFEVAHQRSMIKSQENADKKSLIRQFATPVCIKSGRASFSVNVDKISEPNHMHSFSYTLRWPRSFIFDSVGYELTRFLLRNTKKKSQ